MVKVSNKLSILSVVTLLAALVVSAPSFAVSSGGVGGRPASPDISNPRTSSIFIFKAEGGQTKQDQILVMNSTNEPATLDLYAVDGVTTQTGDLTCRQEVEPREGIGSWIKLSKSSVALGPNSDETVSFSIDVPAKVDVGEHNGCIVIQRQAKSAEMGSGVQLQTRQAIRVAVVVPGNINRTIDVSAFTVSQQDRTQKYTVGLKNVGNVSADVDIKLRVKDMFGKVVYENGGSNVVTANQLRTLTYESQLRPLLGGVYTVDLSISYDKRAGVFGTEDKAQLVTKTAESQQMYLWPSVIAIISTIGVLIVVGLAIAISRKRSKRRRVSLKKLKN